MALRPGIHVRHARPGAHVPVEPPRRYAVSHVPRAHIGTAVRASHAMLDMRVLDLQIYQIRPMAMVQIHVTVPTSIKMKRVKQHVKLFRPDIIGLTAQHRRNAPAIHIVLVG